MILEHFEVENWSCIRRATVTDLPASGVVVLHGPNRTGKSSLVAALRAALFDSQPSSQKADLKRYFPNWTVDAPRVTVGFRAGGESYRVTKEFKKSGGDSRLEQRRGSDWTVLTRTPSEVHDRTLALVGNKASDAGLQQLLWLHQADYRLPDRKDFDSDVQARLRGILGVMQTPLDDAFIEKVKDRWKSWYTARQQPGEKAKRSKTCSLEKDLERLSQARADFAEQDAAFRSIERWLDRAEYLQAESRGLRSEIDRRERDVAALQDQSARSQERLNAFRLAKLHLGSTEGAVHQATTRLRSQAEAASRWAGAREAVTSAQAHADQAGQALAAAERRREENQGRLNGLLDTLRAVRRDLDRVDELRHLAQQRAVLEALRAKLTRAEELHRELQELKQADLDRPAPSRDALAKLVANRQDADRHRTSLDAAAMAFALIAEPGASPATLAIDGAPAIPIPAGPEGRWAVRRRAELAIPGWGRVEVTRGSDARGLDAIERDLVALDRDFRDGIAPFGLAGREPDALERLRTAAAELASRASARTRLQREIKGLGALDLDSTRTEYLRLDAAIRAAAARLADAPTLGDPEERAAALRAEVAQLETQIRDRESAQRTLVDAIEARPSGFRSRASDALNASAASVATAEALRAEVERLPAAEELAAALALAERDRAAAHESLAAAQLSDEELALPGRLADALDALKQRQARLTAVLEELHKLQGSLSQSAGLHQARAEAEAVVDGLRRKTDREILESKAYDRLYELFEECRQKQLTAVAAPVTDRVLRWLRLVGIADYRAIECGDNFLPHALGGRDDRPSLPLDHESTGTQEQIALMVRLALGSVLAPPAEAAVAVLDDPLTHSDPFRMERMRSILKAAALGDPSTTPAAGPLQLLVFTCHPDWFPTDVASIDLGNPAILTRA